MHSCTCANVQGTRAKNPFACSVPLMEVLLVTHKELVSPLKAVSPRGGSYHEQSCYQALCAAPLLHVTAQGCAMGKDKQPVSCSTSEHHRSSLAPPVLAVACAGSHVCLPIPEAKWQREEANQRAEDVSLIRAMTSKLFSILMNIVH